MGPCHAGAKQRSVAAGRSVHDLDSEVPCQWQMRGDTQCWLMLRWSFAGCYGTGVVGVTPRCTSPGALRSPGAARLLAPTLSDGSQTVR